MAHRTFIDFFWATHTMKTYVLMLSYQIKLRRFNSCFGFQNVKAWALLLIIGNMRTVGIVPHICLFINCQMHDILQGNRHFTYSQMTFKAILDYMLLGKNMTFGKYVVDVVDFVPNQNIFKHRLNYKYLSGSNYFTSRLLHLRFNCLHTFFFNNSWYLSIQRSQLMQS